MTTALAMRAKLERLRREHNLAPPTPVTIPLAPPTERPQILSGYAATTTVDRVRNRFRGFAFGAVHRQPFPKLYFKHQQERGEIGAITNLEYDAHGNLIVTAAVTDTVARRAPAWSIGCTVRAFQIVDAASPTAHYALITEALIDEISLTDIPCNPAALVTSRRDVCAMTEFYGHAQQHIALLKKYVTIIQKGAQSCHP